MWWLVTFRLWRCLNFWWFNENPKCPKCLDPRSKSRSESRLIRSGTQEYRYTVDDRLLHCPTRFISIIKWCQNLRGSNMYGGWTPLLEMNSLAFTHDRYIWWIYIPWTGKICWHPCAQANSLHGYQISLKIPTRINKISPISPSPHCKSNHMTQPA